MTQFVLSPREKRMKAERGRGEKKKGQTGEG